MYLTTYNYIVQPNQNPVIDLFKTILKEYPDAYKHKLANKPLKNIITIELPSEIEKLIVEIERYKVKGTIGVGGLPAIPWIAIFDVLITRSAQIGYYPVFLFKDDMSGFCPSATGAYQ